MAVDKKNKKPRKSPPSKEKIVYWTEGEGLSEIQKWLDDGLFDKQIADNMKITQKCLIDWKNKYPVLGLKFMIARGVSVSHVENALYKRALGFHEKEQVIDNKGKKQIVNKYYPPDVAACIFLAKNWAAHKYKDKWDLDVQGKLPIVLSGDDDIAD